MTEDNSMFERFEQNIDESNEKIINEEPLMEVETENPAIYENDIIRFMLAIGLIEYDEIEEAYHTLLPLYRIMIDKTGIYGLKTLGSHLTYVNNLIKTNPNQVVKKIGYLKTTADRFIGRIENGYYNPK